MEKTMIKSETIIGKVFLEKVYFLTNDNKFYTLATLPDDLAEQLGEVIPQVNAISILDGDNPEELQISCDSNGPFFDIYMKGLQPERFYRILVKSTLDGSTTVIDDESVFKVVRNG